MIPQYNTRLFQEMFDDTEDFLNGWKSSEWYQLTVRTVNGTQVPIIKDNSVKLLFCLLLASYANNPIANYSVEQFYIKVWDLIYRFGPTWEKKLEIQQKLRDISDEEILQGAKVINNHALNPSAAPSTGGLTELEYINEQTTQNYRKSKLEAYDLLVSLLETDISREIVDRFKILFKIVVFPENPVLYENEED